MAVRDLGIPVGAVIALTGSGVMPANFRILDGSVVETGGRSIIEGQTLPDWHDGEVMAVGSPAPTGAVSRKEAPMSKTLGWGDFYGFNVTLPIYKRLYGVVSDDMSAGGSENHTTNNTGYFEQDVPYSEGYWQWGLNGSQAGSGWKIANVNSSNARKTQSMQHSHTARIFHTSAHSFTLKSASDPYVFKASTDVSINTTSNTVAAGSEVPVEFSYNLKANVCIWVMRVY